MAIPGLKRFKATTKAHSRNNTDYIINVACEHFNISPVLMKSRTREQHIVIPRMLTMSVLKSKTLLTLKEIGANFNRHHTTVIAAIHATNNMLTTDYEINENYKELLRKL